MFTKYNKEVTKGFFSSQEFWERCQEELKIKDDKNFNFVENWVGDYVAIEKMHQFVKEVNKKYEIGIISNIYEGMFPLMIRQKKIPNIRFVSKILSCDEGLMKPDREIYELAESRISYRGSEILFIDDVKEYIDSAKKMGWQTFQFETYNPEKSIRELYTLLNLN